MAEASACRRFDKAADVCLCRAMAQCGVFGSLDPFYETGEIMGRKVANAGFLDALLAADPCAAYHFFLPHEIGRRELEAVLAQRHPKLHRQGRLVCRPRTELATALAQGGYHCFHCSDCLTHQPWVAWARNRYSPELFPITGVIHSLSRADAMAGFLAHLWPGTTPRDAIVCTSRAGRATMERLFEALSQGYGLGPDHRRPALPQLPLGVDTAALRPAEAGQRQAARAALRVADGATALLVFGRISHHAKMDLLPLLRACQRLAVAGHPLRQLHLILAGGVDPREELADLMARLAANLGLPLSLLANPDDGLRQSCFQAADIFVSIPDNPQETFGLTVLEAGAYGLPVVVADYDGYRDLVVPGVTGLLVPTLGPATTAEVETLARVMPDNQYHLQLAQQTVVDVAGLAAALERLMDHPEERQAMGRAARELVVSRFDWSRVVEGYLTLWQDLWAQPVSAEESQRLREVRHPLGLPFGQAFAAHPSGQLAADQRLVISRSGRAVVRGQEFPLFYAGIAHRVDAQRLRGLLTLARQPMAVAQLLARLAEGAGLGADDAAFVLHWALKHDLLEIAP